MSKLKKLTISQLNKIIDETKDELRYRENMNAAIFEIHAILKKYKIDIQDIDLQALQKTGASKRHNKSAKSANPLDRRRVVKAKHKNPDGIGTWTGRGRTPLWVLDICAKNSITVESFKKDVRFRCE